MKRCSALLLGLPLLFALAPGPALADEPGPECSGEKPWVAVVSRTRAGLDSSLRSDLRAGLLPSNIDVCASPPAGAAEPLARLVIEQVGSSGAHFSLDVTDSVTSKRVGRDLDLGNLPADGRALALAVAAEELLRASWAELALRGVRSAQTSAPPEVRAVVERAPRRATRSELRYIALGARLGFERFLGGQTHFGADLFAGLPFGAMAGGFLALGARRGLSERAAHGSISSSALCAELGFSLSLLRRRSFELSPFVSGRLLRLTFEPAPAAGVAAQNRSGLVVTSRLGLGFAFGSAGVLRSYSALGVGVPLRSFAASDSGRVVAGASELELFASTGVALELR